MPVIDSIKDERIVAARALAGRAGRREAGRCLVEGANLVRQLATGGSRLEYVLHADEVDDGELRDTLAAAGVPVHPVRAGLLRKVVGTARPVGWLAVAVLPPEVPASEPYGDFAVVCDGIADPGNLGTIIRTARALGVRDVVLTDEATDVGSRRVLDAARGAVLDARVRRFPDPVSAVRALKHAGFQVVVTSPRGRHVQAVSPVRGGRVALVVGGETDGASDAVLAAADLTVQIPMAGGSESLNVGVATGISIYELRMRMVLGMLTDRIRDTLGRNLNVTGRLVRQALDVHLRRVGDLDSAQVILLMVLACEKRTPRDELRRDAGASQEELTDLLAPMVERGYVDLDDEGAAITTTGEQVVAALWTVQERVEEELLAGFTAEEGEQLRHLLRRVSENAGRVASEPDVGDR